MVRSKPTLLTLPSPLSARAALATDRNFLLELEEGCMREYVVALWGEWRPRPPDLPLIDNCQVISCFDLSVGCLSLFWNDDHIWIDRLYLDKSHQRRGIGAAIVQWLKKEGDKRGMPIRLAVLSVNPAVYFYLKHGFKIYDRDSKSFYMTSEY